MTIDKKLVAARFAKAAETYDDEAEVQKIVARRLLARVHEHCAIPVHSILEIGCGTGYLSRMLYSSFNPQRMVLNDICLPMREHVRDLLKNDVDFSPGDGETGHFGAGFDLVISSSVVQWFSEPASFIARCFDALAAGGCLALGTYGPENMREMVRFTGMGLEYKSLPEWMSLFSDSWQLVTAGEDMLEKTFATPLNVLHHLRRTGVTGTGNYRWTAGKLRRFTQLYQRHAAMNGKVTLTYHPLYVVARKKG